MCKIYHLQLIIVILILVIDIVIQAHTLNPLDADIIMIMSMVQRPIPNPDTIVSIPLYQYHLNVF